MIYSFKIKFQKYNRLEYLLYCFGSGDNGKLGLETYDNKICKIPTICNTFYHDNIIKIAAYNEHCLCITTSGLIYSFGLNHEKQIGTQHENNSNKPHLLKSLQ
eukprot:92840_1